MNILQSILLPTRSLLQIDLVRFAALIFIKALEGWAFIGD